LTCGAENRAGRKFCAHCGATLEVTCQSCGAANDPDDRYCGSCGSRLPASVEAATALPSVAERRLVSVMFADLVGFTTLSEHRDPEDVRDLLSRYFERCRALIEGSQGRSRSSSATR